MVTSRYGDNRRACVSMELEDLGIVVQESLLWHRLKWSVPTRETRGDLPAWLAVMCMEVLDSEAFPRRTCILGIQRLLTGTLIEARTSRLEWVLCFPRVWMYV
jgi:hypothetical protein